jgi:hypothetical protein
MSQKIFIGAVGIIFLVGALAWAEPGDLSEAPTTAASAQPSQTPRGKRRSVNKKAKGNRVREKETEGTEAPDRFEADTVIKSQYKLDGKPLEVDPD